MMRIPTRSSLRPLFHTVSSICKHKMSLWTPAKSQSYPKKLKYTRDEDVFGVAYAGHNKTHRSLLAHVVGPCILFS
jgi:hypothetical protein